MSKRPSDPIVYLTIRPAKRGYGLFHFLFDCAMVAITCGFWLIWIFVREMRKR